MVGPGVPGMGAENLPTGEDKEDTLTTPEAPVASDGLTVPQGEIQPQPRHSDGDPDEIDLNMPTPEPTATETVKPVAPVKVKFNPGIVDHTPGSVLSASEMTEMVGTGLADEEANLAK
jgi:hypothetical protein